MASLQQAKQRETAFSGAAMLPLAAAYALILSGGVLISVQLRLTIPLGADFIDSYAPHPPLLWLLVLVAALCAAFVHIQDVPISRLLATLTAVGVTVGGSLLVLPDLSQLQLVYFAAASLLIAWIVIGMTPHKYSLQASLVQLWQKRRLLALWVRYNVLSRYSQMILGILWIVMLPVLTAILLTFVFSFILVPGDIGNVPFIAFFLVGLVSWTLFSQGVLQGTVSIVSSMGLINQIYFPREILVLVRLGEALVDLIFVFVVTLVINAVAGIFPNFNYIYLPVLLVIQVALMLGIMFFTSYITVLIRDLQQLTVVVIQLMFYITPIMYPVDILPEGLRDVLQIANPMAAMINAYRDVILYNRPPDFVTLYIPTVLAGVLLYSGYMFFKANERKLADFR